MDTDSWLLHVEPDPAPRIRPHEHVETPAGTRELTFWIRSSMRTGRNMAPSWRRALIAGECRRCFDAVTARDDRDGSAPSREPMRSTRGGSSEHDRGRDGEVTAEVLDAVLRVQQVGRPVDSTFRCLDIIDVVHSHPGEAPLLCSRPHDRLGGRRSGPFTEAGMTRFVLAFAVACALP